MAKSLTNAERKQCAKVVLGFILSKIEELDDVIYEFIPEEIVDEKIDAIIDEFNVFSAQKLIREAFEQKYGKFGEAGDAE